MQNILLIGLLLGLSICEERTFNLESGNKVTGEILNIDENGNYSVQTSMGEVVFNQDEILLENVKIITNDGDRVLGVLSNEDNNNFYVKTNIGQMSVNKKNVKSIDFRIEHLDDDGWNLNLNKSEDRFYYGDEQLIDVWFDPTGNLLSEGTIYISGLSVAYGITDKFQLSLRYWSYALGYVNVRPKYQIYKKDNLEKSNSLSIGGYLYLTGAVPHKWNRKDIYIENYVSGYYEETDNVDYSYWEPITSDEFSYDLFLAYTTSKLKSSGQGRINFNMGISVAQIGGYSDLMPRAWLGLDLDVRKSLKLTGLIAYDKYSPTIAELLNNEELTDIHLDFGFIYALNENFRFGLHLTSPFFGFYWKF